MRKCYGIQKRFIPYLDNALSDKVREKVEEHLKGCAICQKKLETFKKIGELLAKKNKVERSGEYWQEFQNKLKHRITSYYRAGLSVPASSFKLKIALAICSIVLLFAFIARILVKERNLLCSYQTQTVQLQTKIKKLNTKIKGLEQKNRTQTTQLALLKKMAQTPRYQVVILQREGRMNRQEQPAIFYRETTEPGYVRKVIQNLEGDPIPINNLKDF